MMKILTSRSHHFFQRVRSGIICICFFTKKIYNERKYNSHIMLPQSIQKYKLHAKKSLGQNFLVDEGSLENIAGAIEVDGKNIVEVGPGYGALTEKLIAQTPKSLTLVELDSDMIAVLEQRIQEGELQTEGVNIHIEHIDILKYEPIFQVSQPSLQLSPLEDN